MAIIKIHTINKTIDKSIDYITNSEKTDQTIKDDIEDSMDYITDSEKTNNKFYVSGINCSPARASLEFDFVKQRYIDVNGDEGKRLGYHIIQSFNPKDNSTLTPAMAHEIGKKIAAGVVGDEYQCVISTHVDKDHIHNHIIFNAFNFKEIKKFDCTDEVYINLRKENDRLCKEYGLSVIEKPKTKGDKYKEWMERENIQSWKAEIENDINAVKEMCTDWNSFKTYLIAAGYQIKEGKYITYTHPDGIHKVRDKTLGEEYTKQSIEDYWVKPELEVNPEEKKKSYSQFKKANPYRKYNVSRYTSDGTRIPDLWYVIMLAIEIIKGEGDLWLPKEINPNNPYHAKADYKVQNLLDSLQVLEKNNVETLQQLKDKINDIGIQCNKLKSKMNSLEKKKTKYDVINNALEGYFKVKDIAETIYNLPAGEEKETLKEQYSKELKEYNLHKAILYKNKVVKPDEIEIFKEKLNNINSELEKLNNEYKPLAQQYRDLKKAEYRLNLAQQSQYTFGLMYDVDKDIELNKMIEKENQVQREIEQEEQEEKDIDKIEKILR